MIQSKCRTLIDFFQFYKYRKNPSFEKTIPVPYIKKEDESTHKYSLTYHQWKSILEDILIRIEEELIDGQRWVIGSHLGEISIRKKKCKSFVDYKKSKEEGQQVRRARNGFDNIMIFSDWERLQYPLTNRWLWRFKLKRTLKLKIYNNAEKDYTFLNRYLDK